jgi:oligoendopeptidase F
MTTGTRLGAPAAGTAQASAGMGAATAADLGTLPEWDLSDLYASPEASEVKRDIEAAAAAAGDMKARYQGRIVALAEDGAALAEAISAYERLSDLMGKLGSYAGLLYAGNQADPARAKFYGDLSEKLTQISTDLVFFELELNAVAEDQMAKACEHPRARRFEPWLEDLR